MRESLRKLQWCPHRRTTASFDAPGPPFQIETVGGSNSMTAGVGPAQVEIGTCIGSPCSQWRWDFALALETALPTPGTIVQWFRGGDGSLWQVEPLPRPPGVDASYTWRPILGRWDRLEAVLDRDGHCGLAGDAGPQ